MRCPACGAPAPPGARFCPACGHALAGRPDERRVVTVVFADLVGFTTFSEAADPEHVKALVDTCFERLAADVERFGGRVDKIVGDALVALFGAPIAHEDDAERAARAALAMQETLADLRAEHTAALDMRVGVNTGEVLTGALRAGGDYTAMGDVVNTASRLQALAHPGQVLVGDATHRATDGAIEYEPIGPVSVKGRDEPVAVWAARRVRGRPGRRRIRSRVPLVGRTSELALLSEVIATAIRRRRSQQLLVLGDAGIGKRRLGIAAAGVARREHGATIVGGQCVAYGEINPWGPFTEAVRDLVGITVGDSRDAIEAKLSQHLEAVRASDSVAERVRLVHGLAHVLGALDATDDLDASRARDDAFRSLAALFETHASSAPLVFVVGDVHWADDLVFDTIERLLVRLRTTPFVVLMSARPEIDERVEASPANSVRITLDPLDAVATRELASLLFGDDIDDVLAATLYDRSGGNPLFVEELVSLLREPGPDATRPTRTAKIERLHSLPTTLRGVVAARLDAVAEPDRSVLELASVVGLRGTTAEIAAASREPIDDLQPALERLADRNFLQLDDGEFAFTSEAIAGVAYATLTKAERARRHARVGIWLQRRPASVEADAERIANHLVTAAELAGELGGIDGLPPDLSTRAAAVVVEAAEHAERSESWRRSHRLHDRALNIVGDGPQQSALRLGRARAAANLHDLDSARRDVTAVFDNLSDAHVEAIAAEAETVLGDVERRAGNVAAANEAFERAVARWRATGDEAGTAGALRAWGLSKIFEGDLDTAEALVEQALSSFRTTRDARGEAWALQNLAWVAFLRGDSDAADRRADESIRAFRSIDDYGGLHWAQGLLAWVRLQQGRLREAEELMVPSLREAQQTGSVWAEGMGLVLLAVVAMWTGRTKSAVELARRADAHFGEIEDAWGGMQASFPLMRGLLALGDVGGAYAHEPRLRELSARLGDSGMILVPDLNASAMASHLGDAEAALRHARLAYERSEGMGGFIERRTAFGLALLQTGRAEEAVEILDAAHDRATQDSWRAAVAGPSCLAYAAVGETAQVLEIAASTRRLATGSYLDLLLVDYGIGLAHAQRGDELHARSELTGAVAAADSTDSVLDQAVARLALAAGLTALQTDDAADTRADADKRLRQLGITASGWRTAFEAAARGPRRSAGEASS